MTLADKFKNICLSLGRNNKPTYAVIAIATVKGICRPAFTMMDKTEKPETKKYTALREGLTELIAIPVYWASGELAGCFSKYLTKKVVKEDFLPKKIKEDIKNGINNEAVTKALKHAAERVEETKLKITNNLRLAGVCTAALFVIPAVCSVAIKPVVGKIIKPPKKTETVKEPVIQQNELSPRPKITNFGSNPYKTNLALTRPQTGLRVGGI